MTVRDDHEEALAEARAAVERAGAALRGKHTARERTDYREAHEVMLGAERALAEARGEEHAVPCSGFPAWDIGAPIPQLLGGGPRTALVYLVREPDPTWDGSTAQTVGPGDEDLHLVAVVRFERVVAVRMGAPNDEVVHGHPLHGKGLAAHEPFLVERSSWIAELQRMNSVHPGYRAGHWERYRHYLLAFHEQTFECVAEGFSVTTKLSSPKDACREALEDVLR